VIDMKLKHIPNMLGIIRILLTIALIFIYPVLGTLSFIVFCIAGFTDMIDGPLARRIPNGASKLGADIDAFADMFLIIVGVFVLIPAMGVWSWLWFGIIAALAFKILSASLTGLIKHKRVLFTHTIGNKLAAIFLFIAPIIYFIVAYLEGPIIILNIYIIFLMVWVFTVTIEEGLINLLLKKPNTNIRGIWQVSKENAKA